MPFVKGQSGNPGGKPGRTKEHRKFADWCQKTAVKRVWKVLKNALESNTDDRQKWASEIILQRAFGNPVQYNQNENWDMNAEVPTALLEEKKKQLEESLAAIIKSIADTPKTPGIADSGAMGANGQTPSLPA